MDERSPFVLHGGPGAIAHIEQHGLAPQHIACIPGAAGGPKGLALLPLDRLLHAEWLARAGPVELIGASIGAWRMAALAQPDALATLERLQHAWLEHVLLVAPSAALIERLPNRKLPDRQDFYRYGADHEGRERAWNRAIGECGRFAEAVLRWMSRPDPTVILPI